MTSFFSTLLLPNKQSADEKANFQQQLAFSYTVGALKLGAGYACLYWFKLAYDMPDNPSMARVAMLFSYAIFAGHMFNNAKNVLKAQGQRKIQHAERCSKWMHVSHAIREVLSAAPYLPNLMNADVRANLDRQFYFSFTTGVLSLASLWYSMEGYQYMRSHHEDTRVLLLAIPIFAGMKVYHKTREILIAQGAGAIPHPRSSSPLMEAASALHRLTDELWVDLRHSRARGA